MIKSKKCSGTKGYACGKSCISVKKVCRKDGLTGQSIKILNNFADQITATQLGKDFNTEAGKRLSEEANRLVKINKPANIKDALKDTLIFLNDADKEILASDKELLDVYKKSLKTSQGSLDFYKKALEESDPQDQKIVKIYQQAFEQAKKSVKMYTEYVDSLEEDIAKRKATIDKETPANQIQPFKKIDSTDKALLNLFDKQKSKISRIARLEENYSRGIEKLNNVVPFKPKRKEFAESENDLMALREELYNLVDQVRQDIINF